MAWARAPVNRKLASFVQHSSTDYRLPATDYRLIGFVPSRPFPCRMCHNSFFSQHLSSNRPSRNWVRLAQKSRTRRPEGSAVGSPTPGTADLPIGPPPRIGFVCSTDLPPRRRILSRAEPPRRREETEEPTTNNQQPTTDYQQPVFSPATALPVASLSYKCAGVMSRENHEILSHH